MRIATFRSRVMSFGPLGYWRLNEESHLGARDASGFGNAGTYESRAIALMRELGEGIYGAEFPGAAGARVSLPNTPAFRIGQLSGLLVMKDQGSAPGACLVSFTGATTASPGWRVAKAASGNGAALVLDTSAASGQSFAFSGNPFDGARHVLAWAFDESRLYLSTDFSPWTTASYAAGGGPIPDAAAPFRIGEGAGPGSHAKAIVSDAAIFPYVLSDAQLERLGAAFASGNDGLEHTLLRARELTVADLFSFTLADGTVLNWTSFDCDIVVGSVRYSSIGPRIRRGAIKWKRGVEASPLEITVASGSTDIAALGLTVAQAITAGYFNGAMAAASRVYNPVPMSDGSSRADRALALFKGWVGKIEHQRGYARITVNSLLERLNLQWPFVMVQPGCRWTLFDAGCSLEQSAFAHGGAVFAGSTAGRILHSIARPSGYFDQGRIRFTSGANAGIWRSIQAATGAGANGDYRQTVLNDSPAGYWRLGDGPGSAMVADISGNANHGTVHGGVTLGHPGALAGDGTSAAFFDGASGRITLPIGKPSTFAKGISIEFWFMLPAGASAAEPIGIFDTAPDSPLSLRNFSAAGDAPAFQWGRKGKPSVGIIQPAPGTWVHIVVVFRGQNAIDVYYNGRLYGSATAQGRGHIDWKNPITLGNIDGGSRGWFRGYLQEFAIYPYAMAPDQPLAHYNVGVTAARASGAGTIVLAQPLPYPPAAGDAFVAYPGCDKSQRTCQMKFDNLRNFGGFPYVPAPETAA